MKKRSTWKEKYGHKPFYALWETIKNRCAGHGRWNQEKYSHYQNIRIEERIRSSYDNFEELVEPLYTDARKRYGKHVRLFIDRIDPYGNYEEGNIRFISQLESQWNRTDNTMIEYLGYTLPVTFWSKIYGVPLDSLTQRLRNGWTIERALNEPSSYKDKVVYKQHND